MSEPTIPNDEDEIDERGRNPTQQRIDEEGASDAPVDADWQAAGDEEASDIV
jgi:hypothetical protein